MRRRRPTILGLILVWASLVAALGEPRFPPPDFESGYKLPTTQFPAARAQALEYLDVAVLVAALGLASWLVLRKRSRKGVLALSVFSLLYFGFYREGCVCAIGSIQNVALTLFDSRYALPLGILVFFLAPLVTALFFGRSFCAAVCPHGAIQDLVLVKPVTVPRWLEQGLGVLPFAYLGAGVLFAATGSGFLICQYDPFVPIFRLSGSFTLMLLGIGFLLLGVFVGRPYCRFLCPYGALLRLASAVSKWQPRITPDTCTQCRLCQTSCPFGAINEPIAPSPGTGAVAAERRRFLSLVILLPVLVGAGAWMGGRFSGAASTLHPMVKLAELHLEHQGAPAETNLAKATTLALSRAAKNSAELLPAAVEVRRRFGVAGMVFGGWIGLVAGFRLLGFSFWRRRADYEPDRAGCLGCARCFETCPQELIRRGLLPDAAVAASASAGPVPRSGSA
jgi:NosR/NirI family transcriptional regulator, nitrous oxide reductase regulator